MHETPDGIEIDRSLDDEVRVTFPDGYYLRFWDVTKTDSEYIRIAKLLRDELGDFQIP